MVAVALKKKASIDRALAEVRARAGAIDVLVNNAGIGVLAAFEDTTEEELRRVFETNFFGVCAVTRAVLPEMRARRRGRIVNVASVGGRIGSPGVAAYSASKFAVEGLSEALSSELAGLGVEVAIVEPGMYRTPMIGPERRNLSPRAADPSSPYHERCAAIAGVMQDMHVHGGPDPREVAEAIGRAATDAKPRLRYPVGKDAQALLFLKQILPERRFERVFEWLFRRTAARVPA